MRTLFRTLICIIGLTGMFLWSHSDAASYSSRSYSSPSRSYSSPSYSARPSYSSPSRSYSSPSYSRPSKVYSSPTYKPPSQTYTSPSYKPTAPSYTSPRPRSGGTYYGSSSPTVVNHNYGGGNSGPGFWFWMWAFDHNNHGAPVYAAAPSSGVGQAAVSQPSGILVATGPSGWTIFWNILLFGSIIGLLGYGVYYYIYRVK